MGPRFKVFLLVMIIQILIVAANTNSGDVAALNALKSIWKNIPSSWVGADPCGSNWDGISCNGTRITSLILSGLNIQGSLTGDILSLSELQYLDLSNNKDLRGTIPAKIANLKQLSVLMLIGCGLFGPIPDSIGSLNKLSFLALNSNNFTGPIPPSIGNLSSLSWLDLTDNKLTGPLPVSVGTTSGLDKLVNTKHFHFGQNQLSGTIPAQLFHSEMNMIHLIFDNNRFEGQIPATLVDVQTLEVVRLDWNSLNGSVPANLSILTTVSELYLSNNNLNGSIPDLTGMDFLNTLDMSNNSFDPSDVPNWFTSLLSLSTLAMERTQIRGNIPAGLFNLPQLLSLELSNNQLNGTLNLGTSNGNSLALVDLQNNQITNVTQSSGSNMNLKLEGNPVCNGSGLTQSYCIPEKSNSSNAIPANNCSSTTCSSDSVLSPNCKCANPYTGNLYFIAFNYSNWDNSSYDGTLAESLLSSFKANSLPVDSVFLGNPVTDANSYLKVRLEMFPSDQDQFNQTGVLAIGTILNHNPLPIRNSFGPFYFIDENYCCFTGISGGNSIHPGVIAGVTIGCSVLLLLLIGAGIYAFQQRKRAQRTEFNPFASWNDNQGGGGIPQLKEARCFSFEEIKKCTDNFSDSNCIGIGGYGKVYRGTLDNGQVVAIKRAQQGSLQGANEFKTEIELLSRIHHKNVVNLVGFCYEQGEQMLVYEYVPNGTLKDSITEKSGIKLNWMRRLSIALDSAKGLSYLHELADPPIIHRDVKSTNILLGDHLNAKVADFGLCKLLGEGKGYVTTQVKGTLGYMDPEYYMTQQLTDKSDVYSFGIVLFELLTGKAPIERGKYIVRVVKEAMEKSKDPYNLHEVLDPSLDSIPGGLNKFVDLALSCVSDGGAERPKMSEVVREIENILAYATSELKTKSVSSPSSYDGSHGPNPYRPDSSEDLFDYSGGYVGLDVERR